jgi:hypothetical protein
MTENELNPTPPGPSNDFISRRPSRQACTGFEGRIYLLTDHELSLATRSSWRPASAPKSKRDLVALTRF